MARKQAKIEPKALGYVVWHLVDNLIVDDVTFDTRDEAEDYVKTGLQHEDFKDDEVVICELVPRCRPTAPVTEVKFKEIK
jgi:hypothetical protein